MTICDAIAIFPAQSTAVQITVVIPSENDSGSLFDKDKIPLSSFATACPIFRCVKPPVASIKMSSGTIMAGFLKSFGIGFGGCNSTSFSFKCSELVVKSCFSLISSSCSIDVSLSSNFSCETAVENF